MLNLSDCPDGYGESDTNPVVLMDTTESEFEALLKFWYHGYAIDYPALSNIVAPNALLTSQYPDYHPGFDEMLSLLRISKRFECEKVLAFAMSLLTGPWLESPDCRAVPPAEKITLAIEYGIPQWLEQAYASFVRGESSLSVDDAKKLPPEINTLLLMSRDAYRDPKNRAFKFSTRPPLHSSPFGASPTSLFGPKPAFSIASTSSASTPVDKTFDFGSSPSTAQTSPRTPSSQIFGGLFTPPIPPPGGPFSQSSNGTYPSFPVTPFADPPRPSSPPLAPKSFDFTALSSSVPKATGGAASGSSTTSTQCVRSAEEIIADMMVELNIDARYRGKHGA